MATFVIAAILFLLGTALIMAIATALGWVFSLLFPFDLFHASVIALGSLALASWIVMRILASMRDDFLLDSALGLSDDDDDGEYAHDEDEEEEAPEPVRPVRRRRTKRARN